ncbi:hypothetical protein NV391_06780 [Companilactobacillus crustorum]|uniref:hypothetical protein n=1 Tax=Companilactobacillus crustorum TaxID=392416 RepID=UPI00237DF229|nr:hypothetical protein [Companilactobacillus crustorum]WDT64698.1 hypothetical protein NV391_06780 [Companilactobacillus crustorum]
MYDSFNRVLKEKVQTNPDFYNEYNDFLEKSNKQKRISFLIKQFLKKILQGHGDNLLLDFDEESKTGKQCRTEFSQSRNNIVHSSNDYINKIDNNYNWSTLDVDSQSLLNLSGEFDKDEVYQSTGNEKFERAA